MISELDLTKTTDVKNPVYKKITANQYAKKVLMNAMESAFYFDEQLLSGEMSEREIKEVRIQLEKRYKGVKKYLGF